MESALSPSEVLVVVLAAGASRRLGTAKQLVSIGGEPMLRRQCRCALSAGIGPALVILGCEAEQHAQAIADLSIDVRVNNEWPEGMAASLRHAVDVATKRGTATLILACDQYRITPDDLRTLHAVWRRAPWLACMSRWGEYAGPPVILPVEYYDGVRRLRGNTGARALLCETPRPVPLEVANARAQYDLDYPEDLALARSWVSSRSD
jgi:molybdenum cofactor cytidylyltransferase